ncbi:acyltransferase family protein [Colwellia echini]|uniref:Acyltransferase n=1 Tax=Colwellia echini TaxID=1982103 RepID=A0ABY3MU93_9GAMM|nr:acyltransferase family protein [Colwellia echini]TYK64772.1 acyltransferase [Colwellia echini]
MKFRKDINGLRAIAVIAVVLFHFNPAWMPGGFAGVDVFFVISGFLMTSIIFRGIEQENFSILKFYVARANRIIPALALLCFVMLIFGWFYLTSLDYESLGKHVTSSILFFSNIVYWQESGYFSPASNEKWLLHTWSLSVEWQFYIIYPLLLVIMKKFMAVRLMKGLVLICAILGFVYCVIATFKWPNSSYYLLTTRAWEMMIGGVACLYPISLRENRKKLVEWTGMILVVLSYIYISKEDAWPGYLALFPVLGAFLIIQANRSNSIITNNRVFQCLGAWSYSIYLWHWPFVVAIYSFSLSETFVYLGITLSIIFGYLSNRYIEKANFRKDFSNIHHIIKCKPIIFLLIVSSLGGYIYYQSGIDTSIRRGASTPQAKFLTTYTIASSEKGRFDSYWLKCNSYTSLTHNNDLNIAPICLTSKGEGGVFLWGDSHAEALSLGLRTLLKPMGIPFYQKTSAGCKPSLNDSKMKMAVFRKSCIHSNKLALESIYKLKPQLVILAQSMAHDETQWVEIVTKIKSAGVKSVLLIGPLPQWQPSLPKVMIKPIHWTSNENFINDAGLDVTLIELDSIMKNRFADAKLEYISLIDELCRLNTGKYYCRVKVNSGKLFQVDYGHLSDEGSLFVVNEILADKVIGLLTNTNN